MIISHQHRFVLIHNPKTAGMSLRSVLLPYHDDPIPPEGIIQSPPFDYPLDFAHLRLSELAELSPQAISVVLLYRSLVFVRDPYRRFVSAIDQHFKTFHPDVPLQTLRPEEHVLLVETFIEKMLCLERVRTDFRFVHLSPQVWFLEIGGHRLPTDIVPMDDSGTFIVRGLERLGLQSVAVPHDNRSRLDLTHVLKSRKVRAFIRDFYADDFAFLLADPALKHLAGETTASSIGALSLPEDTARGRCREVASTPDPSDLAIRIRLISAAATASDAAVTEESMDATEFSSVQVGYAAADLAAGQAGAALDRIETVLTRHPGYPRALGLLGQIAVFAGVPAAGLAPLQLAAARDPRLQDWLWLALCLAKLGWSEDAKETISIGIGTMPPTANAHFAVGIIYEALGLYDDAARFYGQCVALDPDRSDALYRCAKSLQGTGKAEAAVEAYLQAVQTCNAKADYFADLSAELSGLTDADAAGKTAGEFDPDCTVAHHDFGRALLNLNRSNEAIAA